MNKKLLLGHLKADIGNKTLVIELDGTLNHLPEGKEKFNCTAKNQLLSVDRKNIG